MSKTKKTTKVATFRSFVADCGHEVIGGLDCVEAHRLGEGHMLVFTSCGLVAWSNKFSSPNPGDRVILKKGAPRSHGAMPWVMTGPA